jgi:hypothetical protein
MYDCQTTFRKVQEFVQCLYQNETKSDFEKVAQFKFAMNSALGWLSAFFCVVCLTYISYIITLPVTFIMAASMLATFGVVDWIDLNSPITFAIVGLASFTLFFPGMVIGRFLLRAIPPRLSGKRRKGVIGCFALLTILWVVTSFFNFQDFNSIGPISLTPEAKESLKKIAEGFQLKVFSPAAIQTLLFLMAVFWWLGFGVPVGVRHLNPRYFLKRPFVLLLRRFSKFPDRTVQHALLKYTPAGKPVAFLTPTRSRAGDWNPFGIGFSGIKLWRPIRSMPVILRSTNEDWRRAAQELINYAEIIVLDVSEGSGAIQSEIDMIEAADRWHNGVILEKEGKADTNVAEQIAQFSAKGAKVVVYKKSWIRALPRLIFGFLATLLIITPFL